MTQPYNTTLRHFTNITFIKVSVALCQYSTHVGLMTLYEHCPSFIASFLTAKMFVAET